MVREKKDKIHFLILKLQKIGVIGISMAQNSFPYSYFEGKIVPSEDAKVSVQTHALQYGTGVFGGIRGYYNETKKISMSFDCRNIANVL